MIEVKNTESASMTPQATTQAADLLVPAETDRLMREIMDFVHACQKDPMAACGAKYKQLEGVISTAMLANAPAAAPLTKVQAAEWAEAVLSDEDIHNIARRCDDSVKGDLRYLWLARAVLSQAARSARPQVLTHAPIQINTWADAYEREGGHALIVQMLRSYAAYASRPVPGALSESVEVNALVAAVHEWSADRSVKDWGEADLMKAMATLDGDWPGCEGCDHECDEPCMPSTVAEFHRAIDEAIAQLVHDGLLVRYNGYEPPAGWTPSTPRRRKIPIRAAAASNVTQEELTVKDAPLAAISGYSIATSDKRFADEIQVQRTSRPDGPPLWAVRLNGDCLNKSGQWEWEPLPSSRDDAFLDRCRFDSHTAAIYAALRVVQKV